jgi:hypothetical protein
MSTASLQGVRQQLHARHMWNSYTATLHITMLNLMQQANKVRKAATWHETNGL